MSGTTKQVCYKLNLLFSKMLSIDSLEKFLWIFYGEPMDLKYVVISVCRIFNQIYIYYNYYDVVFR